MLMARLVQVRQATTDSGLLARAQTSALICAIRKTQAGCCRLVGDAGMIPASWLAVRADRARTALPSDVAA